MSVLLLASVFLSTKTSSLATQPASQPADELALADWPMSPAAKRGREVYLRFCVGCHGQEGLGDGPASRYLEPRPRNFQHGAFKFRTTPTGKLPKEEDLLRTITNGLPGSSMPEFRLVSEPQRRDVAQYVLHLATYRRGKIEVEDLMQRKGLTLQAVLDEHIGEIKQQVWERRVESVSPVGVPPSPRVTPALLAKGQTRYLKECVKCHGESGRGDGPSSFTLRDWKDEEILARDLTTGVYRAGSRPADLFTRMRTGLNGTPMPSIPGSDDEIWALAHYIRSLKADRSGTGEGR